jgi:hypothetical protein
VIIRVGKLLYINGSFSIDGLEDILKKIFDKIAEIVRWFPWII